MPAPAPTQPQPKRSCTDWPPDARNSLEFNFFFSPLRYHVRFKYMERTPLSRRRRHSSHALEVFFLLGVLVIATEDGLSASPFGL
ncbi:hypothetical protein BDV36DRAFT_276951 [Aspergillus pseudocaelatus]|uniref:Uncharacterized protein n=1 Tax=Aspergillus pseudocaelatus TaxID=1825620 RepID=A0ABQ6W0N0_9EURO|nr:hypothetical protein BDV36DRAFT_276951 [Aspergillus pseudocaelatus]